MQNPQTHNIYYMSMAEPYMSYFTSFHKTVIIWLEYYLYTYKVHHSNEFVEILSKEWLKSVTVWKPNAHATLIFLCWLMFRFLLIILVTNCALRIRFIEEQQTNIWIFNVAFKRLKHRVVISYTLCVGLMLAGPLQYAVLQTTKYHNAHRLRINFSLITTSPPSSIVVRAPHDDRRGLVSIRLHQHRLSNVCQQILSQTSVCYLSRFYFQHCQEIL